MGWCSYHATHYTKNGAVDKKAECNAYFKEGINRGNYRILKSTMAGNTYYAAVKLLKAYKGEDEDGNSLYEDLPESEQEVFAVVILTSVDNKSWDNFAYKSMNETCGPCEINCPVGILKLLSPTNNEYARNWRECCYKNAESKKKLRSLPIGAKIHFTQCAGTKYEKQLTLQKMPPAYQFKTDWWKVVGKNTYCRKSDIPIDFDVLAV